MNSLDRLLQRIFEFIKAKGVVGIAGLAKIAKDGGPKVIKAAVKIIKK